MAKGVNKAILIGNLGKDPELSYTQSGTARCVFSLATSSSYNNSAGERQERTEWHNIVAWRKLGETISKYLKKGSQAYIEGRIQTRSYDDKDGNKRYITEINASEVTFLGGKGDRDQNQDSGYSSGGGGGSDSGSQVNPSFSGPDDDDIPF